MRRGPVHEWVSTSAYAIWRIAFHVLPCYAESSLISFVLYVSIECVAFLWVAIPYT